MLNKYIAILWRGKHCWLLILLGLLLGFSSLVDAHSRSQSFSQWSVSNERVSFVFTVKSREVTRLPPLEGGAPEMNSLLGNHLKRSLTVQFNDSACRLDDSLTILQARKGFIRAEGNFYCSGMEIQADSAEEKSLTINNHSFFTLVPSHMHYARVGMSGEMPEEYVFSNAQRQLRFSLDGAGIGSANSFMTYLFLGVEHILFGLDHLVFVLTLLLVSGSRRQLVWLISGFTLGHSVTLGLASTGVVIPNIPVIESFIGFTIVLIALECFLKRQPIFNMAVMGLSTVLVGLAVASLVWPLTLSLVPLLGLLCFACAYLTLTRKQELTLPLHLVMTTVFGLIHGFGFSNVLMEIGLPAEKTIVALLAFNLGVEAGQLIFIASVLLALSLIPKRWMTWRSAWATCSASAFCGVGAYWFVERALTI